MSSEKAIVEENQKEEVETVEEMDTGGSAEAQADEEMEVEDKEEEKSEKAVELASPRPNRQRKSVRRFADDTGRVSSPKPLAFEKGQGTELKDIPNVAFKLSKRKADENLQLLHTILYGKKAKVQILKRNIGRFSGFVWFENEKEKQRLKLKEKLDKCTKDKLLDFSDVFNISVNKGAIKKEELITKLSEFLESPHATTDTLLADKEKVKKRKGSTSKSPGSSNVIAKKSTKKTKFESGTEKKQLTKEGDGKSESSQSEDKRDDDKTVDEVESETEEKVYSGNETDQDKDTGEKQDESVNKKVVEKTAQQDTGKSVEKPKTIAKESSVKASGSSGKAAASKKGKSDVKTKVEAKTSPSKNKKVEKEPEKDAIKPVKDSTTSKKKSSKSSASEKDQGKGKNVTKVKEPTREEMHAVAVELLKGVDFHVVTLSDILKQLGAHFGVDLIHRKDEVKDVISEAINDMTDDEDDEPDDDEATNDGDDSDGDGEDVEEGADEKDVEAAADEKDDE